MKAILPGIKAQKSSLIINVMLIAAVGFAIGSRYYALLNTAL